MCVCVGVRERETQESGRTACCECQEEEGGREEEEGGGGQEGARGAKFG